MSEKVLGLTDLWSEKDLIERLNLKVGKTGRSKTLGNWINRGLPYFKHGDRRFFLGTEVMTFMKANLAKGQRCGSV
jgi:hypothetical protein